MKKLLAALGVLHVVLSATLPAEAYFAGTQVERFPQKLTQTALRAVGEKAVEDELATIGETRRHEVTFLRVTEMSLPPGTVSMKAEVVGGLRYTGQTPVRILAFVDGKLYRSVTAYYMVRVYDTVLVANRNLRSNETMTPADVRTQEIEVTSNAAPYFHEFSEIADRVPARNILEGTPLVDTYFQQPILVEAGTPVTIVTKSGSIGVKAAGVAMQRGRRGQKIRVRNTSSGRILYGTVKDEATVEIG